jgi:hypothetical protein
LKVDLIDLLKQRRIIHPTRFTRLKSEFNAAISVEASGFPWWLENAAPGTEGTVTFKFEGIADGHFDSTFFLSDALDEDLEEFDTRRLEEIDWALDPHCDVFCSTPIPDVMGLFAALHDFLKLQDCPFPPMRYLNPPSGTMRRFSELAASSSFLACSAPEGISRFVCGQLEKQGVRYSIVRGEDVSAGLLWVRIGPSQFACAKAYAIIGD